MSAQTASPLIDRTKVETVSLEEFLSGRIDYRPIGDYEAIAAAILADFEAVGGDEKEKNETLGTYLYLVIEGYPE